MSPEERQTLADLLFPDLSLTPESVLEQYPKRTLPEGAWVSRFAPSPTGFIHIGGVFTALISRMLTKSTGGVYILRIEDTDQSRQVERGIEQIVEAFKKVDLLPDEGPYTVDPIQERGAYGPYLQSERLQLYQVYIKQMIASGMAYPCFMTNDELDEVREQQQAQKIRQGIYGEWARSRDLSLAEIQADLAARKEFVIRIWADKLPDQIKISDKIRESLELPANDLDSILLKSDFFPTYHFAHVIDDYLMGVNIVLRGEEWIPSIPLHIQIHKALGLPLPEYAHFAPIAKMDGNSKRKLSKRKDPEAAMSFYYEEGYPKDAIFEYLLNLANSNFEDWRKEHPADSYWDFPFDVNVMNRAMALFDIEKLNNIAKEIIATFSAEEVYGQVTDWAESYQPELHTILVRDPDFSTRVFNIERGGEEPRKDLAKWSDVIESYGMLFDDYFNQKVPAAYEHMPALGSENILALLDYFMETAPQTVNEDHASWLQRLREFSESQGYTKRNKDLKKNPEQYKGWFGDVMMVFRIALAGETKTPDLYAMIRALGTDKTIERLQLAYQHFAS